MIQSVKRLAGSLSSLADSLNEGLHKNKWKDCKSDIEYMTAKAKTLKSECENYKKHYEKKIDKYWIKRLQNTHKFCDGDLNEIDWKEEI